MPQYQIWLCMPFYLSHRWMTLPAPDRETLPWKVCGCCHFNCRTQNISALRVPACEKTWWNTWLNTVIQSTLVLWSSRSWWSSFWFHMGLHCFNSHCPKLKVFWHILQVTSNSLLAPANHSLYFTSWSQIALNLHLPIFFSGHPFACRRPGA